MKNLTYKLKIAFCLVILFCLISPTYSFARVQNHVPVEKEKVHKNKKKQAKENKRLLKRQAKLKKITIDGYEGMLIAYLVVFLLAVVAITGIILFIVGLATANPVVWIVGLSLIGLFIIGLLISLFVRF